MEWYVDQAGVTICMRQADLVPLGLKNVSYPAFVGRFLTFNHNKAKSVGCGRLHNFYSRHAQNVFSIFRWYVHGKEGGVWHWKSLIPVKRGRCLRIRCVFIWEKFAHWKKTMLYITCQWRASFSFTEWTSLIWLNVKANIRFMFFSTELVGLTWLAQLDRIMASGSVDGNASVCHECSVWKV